MNAKEQNRTKFPTVAAFVDQLRAAGVTVTVAYASENGNEAGDRARYDEWDRAALARAADNAAIEQAKRRMYDEARPKSGARKARAVA